MANNYIKLKKKNIDMEIMSITAKTIRELGVHEWERICRSYVLPESYILSYTNIIGWDNIVKYQRLTPSFIKRWFKNFPNGINDAIKYQEVDIDTIIENINDVDLGILEKSKFISDAVKTAIKDKLN